MVEKWVYYFGAGVSEGDASMNEVLGGKGANLAEMCRLNIPIPPGFTISTKVCNHFLRNNGNVPKSLSQQVNSCIKRLEQDLSLEFGNPKKPLLLSVRSGAPISMPGMMDTVLNLGLNDEIVEELIKSNDPRFILDSYRRFIQMYGDVVLKIEHSQFELIFHNIKLANKEYEDSQVSPKTLQLVLKEYQALVLEKTGKPFPQQPEKQLWTAISSVFNSWNSNRAKKFRLINSINEDLGTAVNIQAMVFGNKSEKSATGVAFTRNPSTGEKNFYGEFLCNAQGEDVVAGIRTPNPITIQNKQTIGGDKDSLEELMPSIYQELYKVGQKLEAHYKDVQDIEFTIEEGKLWILQTRSAKRTAAAAVRIAMDLLAEGLITEREVLNRINPKQIQDLLHPSLKIKKDLKVVSKGLPASPGAASGIIVFDAETAVEKAKLEPVILLRKETSPEDIEGMHIASGILTSRGGMTSHAAVVARGMGKPCITAAHELVIDENNKKVSLGSTTLHEGDYLTINGSTGEIILGKSEMEAPKLDDNMRKLLRLSEKLSKMKVRVNAEAHTDIETAQGFGVEGVGLCRTEHMFFQADRIKLVRAMILTTDAKEQKEIIKEIAKYQQSDFEAIFRQMRGQAITVRLLDPPLHEFLPFGKREIEDLSSSLNMPYEELSLRIKELQELNPMLGHRGCRLGITNPAIYEMQIEAILKAASIVAPSENFIEIMVPFVITTSELIYMRKLVDKVAERLNFYNFSFGTMIELPRAALQAGEIAKCVDFISFGTNDLTQATLGLSRDDCQRFLDKYLEQNIITTNPFETLDLDGVGELIKHAIRKAKEHNPNVKIGVCGEHAGEEKSIKFFNSLAIDYISCSPFRVPGAKLAAAKANLK